MIRGVVAVGAVVAGTIVTTVVCFFLGVGVGFFKNGNPLKPQPIRIVYCGAGTADPDCTHARRGTQAGLTPSPNTPPPRMGSPR